MRSEIKCLLTDATVEAALATDRPTGPLRLPTTPQSAAVKRKTGTETPSDGLHNYGTRHREKRQRVTDPGPGPLRHRKAPAPTTPRGNESASVRLAPASSSNRTSSKRSIKKSSKGVFDGVVLSARKPVSNHSRSTPVRRPTQPKGKAGRAYEEETANVDTDEDGELGGLGQVDVDDEEGHIQEQEEWDVSGELLEKGSSHLEGSNKGEYLDVQRKEVVMVAGTAHTIITILKLASNVPENSFGEEQEMSDEGVLEGGDGGGKPFVFPHNFVGTDITIFSKELSPRVSLALVL